MINHLDVIHVRHHVEEIIHQTGIHVLPLNEIHLLFVNLENPVPNVIHVVDQNEIHVQCVILVPSVTHVTHAVDLNVIHVLPQNAIPVQHNPKEILVDHQNVIHAHAVIQSVKKIHASKKKKNHAIDQNMIHANHLVALIHVKKDLKFHKQCIVIDMKICVHQIHVQFLIHVIHVKVICLISSKLRQS